MKKLITLLTLTLALNFLGAAGAVAWLFVGGGLDKAKVAAIREIMFPPVISPELVSTTQPSTQPTTKPASQLDDLLARYAGRRAGEQVELLQQSVDAQAAALDRRSRELDNLLGQILREKEELARKSTALDTDRKAVVDQEKQQMAMASDKGFQDSLKLYSAMPGKSAKSAFMGMQDDLVVRYLQSMPQRTATKIIKEFKSPEEQERINRVLDRMRQGTPATLPAGEAGIRGSPPQAAG